VPPSYCKKLPVWATAIGLLVFFIFSCAQVPAFYADPQYYVQSALLWPRGELTFAASWLGSRDFVVFVYHLMFLAFGASLDSLSIGLALISLCTNLALAVTIFSLVREPISAASVSLAAALVFITLRPAYLPIVMQSSASDNLAILALACMWAVWSVGWQQRDSPTLWILFPFAAGIAAHIRGEFIVFPAIAAVVATFYTRWADWRNLIGRSALGVCTLTLGLALPVLLWPLWVPGPKPDAYRTTFLIAYPFEKFARGSNGPVSAALADQLGLPLEVPIPFWNALAMTYSHFGAKVSETMVTRAGAEAARQNFSCWIAEAGKSAKDILLLPGSISMGLTRWEKQEENARQTLREFDEYRLATSAQYGNDATAPTHMLADQHLSFLTMLRSVIPPLQLETIIPGLVAVLTPLMVVGLAFRLRPSQTVALLPPPLYGIFILILGSLTNGSHPRYLAPLLGFDLIVCAVVLINVARLTESEASV
jgi:hypothetical protein